MRFVVPAVLVAVIVTIGRASPPSDTVVPDPLGTLDGAPVTRSAFEHWLLESQGPPNIAPFFEELAVLAGAKKLGQSVAAADVEAALDEEWNYILRERFNGDEAAYVKELRVIGHSPTSLRNARRHAMTIDLTIERCARALRATDDAALQAKLGEIYGGPPVRRAVRVIFVDRRKPHPDDVPAGATDDRDGRSAAAKARVDRALARCEAGEDFAAVARDLSDDASAAKGGEIAPFRAETRFNGGLDAAVVALKTPGERSPIVETRTGFGIVQLESIADATFASTRDELKQIVHDEPVLPDEREAARRKLLDQVKSEIKPID